MELRCERSVRRGNKAQGGEFEIGGVKGQRLKIHGLGFGGADQRHG